MDLDDREMRDSTPPLKRRKTSDDGNEASPSPRTSPSPGRQLRQGTRLDTRSPNVRDRRRYRSRSADYSQSPLRRRPSSTGSSGRSRSRSVHSDSRRPSRSRSRTRSPRSSRRRSTSTNRTRTESYSPQPKTPKQERLKPNYRPKLALRGHTKPVSQVRISPDGRWIASASADATVKIWDAATGTHIDTLVGHMAGVSCVAWSPDSDTLSTGSDDKAIRLWDRVTGRPKTTTRKALAGQEMPPLKGHHNYVHCLAFSPKGNILASGSYDEAVFLWDVRAGRLMRSLPAHSDPVSGIDFCCDGTLVVSCSTDGLIRVWDTSTGQCLRTLVHEDNPAVTNVCFSPNGRYVLAFNLDNCLRMWDYVAGAVKKTYQGHRNEKFAVGGCFAVLDDQPFIASASEDGGIVLWDVKSKDVLQRVNGHKGVCFWVDVHGDTMVSAGQDHVIRVYTHHRDLPLAADRAVVPLNGDAELGQQEKQSFKADMPIRQEDIKIEES